MVSHETITPARMLTLSCYHLNENCLLLDIVRKDTISHKTIVLHLPYAHPQLLPPAGKLLDILRTYSISHESTVLHLLPVCSPSAATICSKIT